MKVAKCAENIDELESSLELVAPQGWFSSFCRPFSMSNEEPEFLTSVEDKERGWNREPQEAAVIFGKDGVPYINDEMALPNEGETARLDGDFARLVDSVLCGGTGKPSR
jgi:hypothetical protein